MAGIGIGYVVTEWLCREKPIDSGCGYGFYFFSPLSAIVLLVIFFVVSAILSRRNILTLSKKYQIAIFVVLLLAFIFFANKLLTEIIGLRLF